jgi:hypothetical protein
VKQNGNSKAPRTALKKAAGFFFHFFFASTHQNFEFPFREKKILLLV